jgi:gluconolactonase
MRITLTSRSSLLTLTSAFALGMAACGSSGGTGAGGTNGGGGSGGSSSGGHGGGGAGTSGTAGSGAGTAGTSGTAGATGTAGTTGTGGTSGAAGATGTAGTSGTGGTTGAAGTTGAGGAAGTGSGFTPYVCPTGMTSPTSFPAGSTATRIAGAPPSDAFNNNGNDFTNVEGPVWIGNALYVSEFGSQTKPPPSRIIKIDASDTVTVAFPSIADTGSNGLAVDKNGNIVSANHGVGGIVEFTLPSGTPMNTLTNSFAGKRFNSPNDLTIRSDGTVYFTDPSGFQGNMVQATNGVYMLPPGSSTAMEIVSTLNGPNGVTLSLDEKTLYIGDNGDGIMKYSVNSDGSIGATGAALNTTDLPHENTDGMAIDCAGDVYVVRVNEHDIIVVNPAGTTIGHITGIVGNGQLTNVAFGGTDHKTLYITAQGTGTQRGVFKLPLSIPGMPY